MAIEIREYQGDFQDLAQFARDVWVAEYAGRIWFPIIDAEYFRWRLSLYDGATCIVAYDGTKLVGSVVSVPQELRIRGTNYRVGMYTGFTVEPAYRRVALPLIERLRRVSEERGLAFGIGMMLDDPSSASYRFWTKYAESFPRNYRFLFRGGYWAKFLAPQVLAHAGVQAWERVASRVVGPTLALTPFAGDPNVRAFRPEDLPACARLLSATTAKVEWAQVWSDKALSGQLQGPDHITLVWERDRAVRGFVNCHRLSLQGRKLIAVALIDLWADAELSGAERVRLLSALCRELRARDIHGVIAARSVIIPKSAMLANLFLAGGQKFQIGVFPTSRAIPLSSPKTWFFEIT